MKSLSFYLTNEKSRSFWPMKSCFLTNEKSIFFLTNEILYFKLTNANTRLENVGLCFYFYYSNIFNSCYIFVIIYLLRNDIFAWKLVSCLFSQKSKCWTFSRNKIYIPDIFTFVRISRDFMSQNILCMLKVIILSLFYLPLQKKRERTVQKLTLCVSSIILLETYIRLFLWVYYIRRNRERQRFSS